MQRTSWGARLLAATAALALFAGSALAQDRPFHWLEDSTVSITTANTSAPVALKRMPSGITQIRIMTACATTIFIRKGTSASTTAVAATDLPVAPGSVEVLTLLNNETAPITHIAMISPSGSCTVYFTTGQGF